MKNNEKNKRKWQWLHEVIYDLIFSIHGAVNADFLTGWRLANKYALWVQKIEATKSERDKQKGSSRMDEKIETLLSQTKTGIINIKNKEGAKKWNKILSEMEEEEREKTLFNLAEVSRGERLKKWHSFIWNVLFAVFGSMCASFDSGYYSANKHYRRVISRRAKKIRKILEG